MSSTKRYILTMNIKGTFLRDIVNGDKTAEFRCIKPYWDKRLNDYDPPFLLRFINGMRPGAPEVIIEVVKIQKYKKSTDDCPDGVYCLRLGEIKSKKNLRNLVK